MKLRSSCSLSLAVCLLFGWQITKAGDQPKTVDTIPVSNGGRVVRVPVQGWGTTLYFLLDTGASRTVLDASHIAELGPVLRTGSAISSSGRMTNLKSYSAPDLLLGRQRVVLPEVITADLQPLAQVAGEQCDGILGMDFFHDHLVALDLDHDQIRLDAPTPVDGSDGTVALPLIAQKFHHFAVRAIINGVAIDLMLDTSASASLSLNAGDWDRVFPPGAKTKTARSLARTVDGSTREIVMARVTSLELGSLAARDLICSRTPGPEAPSTLGLGFLRRYRVTFDFPHATLFLRSGARSDEVEEADMSGLHILRIAGETIVHSVDEGSAGAQADIRAGDQLVQIDGMPVASMRVEAVRDLLKTGDGRRLSIDGRRHGLDFRCSLVLRKEL